MLFNLNETSDSYLPVYMALGYFLLDKLTTKCKAIPQAPY